MRLLRALRIVLDMELQSGDLTYQAAVERAVSVARLGDAFRLRRFHDRVLSYGHMPPTLVARAITAADEREQHRPPDDG